MKKKQLRKGMQKSLFLSSQADSIIKKAQQTTGLSYSELVSISIEYLNTDIPKIANAYKVQFLDRKDKIKLAISKYFKSGQIVQTKEIIKVVQTEYPDIPQSSILPSDFCNNHKNKDPYSGKFHIFSKIHRGKYKVL